MAYNKPRLRTAFAKAQAQVSMPNDETIDVMFTGNLLMWFLCGALVSQAPAHMKQMPPKATWQLPAMFNHKSNQRGLLTLPLSIFIR